VRAICVYGAEARRKNFGFQVLAAMGGGATMRVPCDQRGNPTCAADFAGWLLPLLEQRQSGVFHLAGPHPECTRPEWARKLVAAFETLGHSARAGFGLEEVPTAELRQPAPRPLRAGMVSTRLGPKALEPTPFLETVRRMIG